MTNQVVVVLDFGGQYKELIARAVREMKVYSVILPNSTPISEIKKLNPIGIVLTGGPNSVYAEGAPTCDKELFSLGVPVLGICYGMQLMCHLLGGKIIPCDQSEYGKTSTEFNDHSVLFNGLAKVSDTLMSHTDYVKELPNGFVNTAKTKNCPNAAAEDSERGLYAVQFHPETTHTRYGKKMLRNFIYNACNAKGDYNNSAFIKEQIKLIREQVGNNTVILALSGGVDSSVCAAILEKAIPNQLVCVFVDHGLMRMNEGDEIESIFGGKNLNFIHVNAKDRFLGKLKGVTDPETKRKIIGEEFTRVFEEEANKFTGEKFLAQGTIYPDVVESGTADGAVIKSHHNVGGLPKDMLFCGLVEPLRGLFKDEVRKVGLKLGLPKELIYRQPFPGPGLAIRVMGEITEEKLDILRQADIIFRTELEQSKSKAHQYFAVLTNVRSVGVMGDGRTYDYTVALRAVTTSDFMTCEYTPLPHSLLSKVSSRIINEVDGINRVVYDITPKPPATIEWE